MGKLSSALEITPSAINIIAFLESGEAKLICSFENTYDEIRKQNALCYQNTETVYGINTEATMHYVNKIANDLRAKIQSVKNFTPSEYCCVANVPANSSVKFKHDILKICKIANIYFTRIRFIDNASAVLLAHNYKNLLEEEYYALVFNIDENFWDVGIFSCEEGLLEARVKKSYKLSLTDTLKINTILNIAIKEANISKCNISQIIVNTRNHGNFSTLISTLTEYFGETKPSLNFRSGLLGQGIAVQTAILNDCKNEKIESLLLIESLSQSIGIQTLDNTFSRIIASNSAIPVKASLTVTTVFDNQAEMLVNFYEGNHDNIQLNLILCQLYVKDINPAPKGVPRIIVTVEIDSSGLLTMEAINGETDEKISLIFDENFTDSFKVLDVPSDVAVYQPPKLTDKEIKDAMKNKN